MAKHGESPGRSSETVRVAEQGSLPAIHLSCSERLKNLAHPLAEAMSDSARLTAFVAAGVDAINEIYQLRAALSQIRQVAENDGLSHWVEFCDAALNITCGGCSGPSSLAVVITTKYPESHRGEPRRALLPKDGTP